MHFPYLYSLDFIFDRDIKSLQINSFNIKMYWMKYHQELFRGPSNFIRRIYDQWIYTPEFIQKEIKDYFIKFAHEISHPVQISRIRWVHGWQSYPSKGLLEYF